MSGHRSSLGRESRAMQGRGWFGPNRGYAQANPMNHVPSPPLDINDLISVPSGQGPPSVGEREFV